MFKVGDKVVFKPEVHGLYDFIDHSKYMTVIETVNVNGGEGLQLMTNAGRIGVWDASWVMLVSEPPPKLKLLRKERIK